MSNDQNSTAANGGDTANKTCFVLCKLPTGLIIESGYTFPKNGIGIARLPNAREKRIRLLPCIPFPVRRRCRAWWSHTRFGQQGSKRSTLIRGG